MSIKRQDIAIMERSLYPSGRAWDYARSGDTLGAKVEYYTDGTGAVYTDGLGNKYISGRKSAEDSGAAALEVRRQMIYEALESINSIESQLYPDNEAFSNTDLEAHERLYGITPAAGQSFIDRRASVYARMAFPRGAGYCGTAWHLQNVLDAAGFAPLTVHENRFLPLPSYAQAGVAIAGVHTFGGAYRNASDFESIDADPSYSQICANSIYPEKDADAATGTDGSWARPYYIFISAPVLFQPAYVPVSRITELRDLILKNKEAHVCAFLYVTTEEI
jgi:hypothetical protein